MNHELQVIITVTLLVAATVLAVISDVVRIRALRRADAEAVPAPAVAAQTLSRHTLVPEIPVPQVSNGRASRLAASIKEKKRSLSPAAMAAIERGSKLARKGAAKAVPSKELQRVG